VELHCTKTKSENNAAINEVIGYDWAFKIKAKS